jgi:hypothetical protein
MVGVAQLVEHWVVAPVVAGSSPVTHPIKAFSSAPPYPALLEPGNSQTGEKS